MDVKFFYCLDCERQVNVNHLTGLKTNRSTAICEFCHKKNVKHYKEVPDKFTNEDLERIKENLKARTIL